MDIIEILKVILLGIVEGITEWLPVSSTGHMILVDSLFTLNQPQDFKDMFFVVIQLGAILSVVVLFFAKLWPIKKTEANLLTLDRGILSTWGKILLACLPAGVIGIIFDDFLEAHLHTPLVIAITLIVYGVAFIIVESRRPSTDTAPTGISYKTAILIGAFQVLSLIPGTSRSGATILGALILGVDRQNAAEFTFLLAVPVMVGASAIKLLKFLMVSTFTLPQVIYLLIGCVVAFVVSMLVIKFLMNFVKKHDFRVFGYYRIALGVVVIATLILPTLI